MPTISDRDQKENIQPLHWYESIHLLLLKPSSYTMKGGKKKQFGFIAQDVEELPINNIVFKNDRGVRSLAYNQLIPLLVHHIQHLTERVAQLESEKAIPSLPHTIA